MPTRYDASSSANGLSTSERVSLPGILAKATMKRLRSRIRAIVGEQARVGARERFRGAIGKACIDEQHIGLLGVHQVGDLVQRNGRLLDRTSWRGVARHQQIAAARVERHALEIEQCNFGVFQFATEFVHVLPHARLVLLAAEDDAVVHPLETVGDA